MARGQQSPICVQDKHITLLLWRGGDAREAVRGRGETQSCHVTLSQQQDPGQNWGRIRGMEDGGSLGHTTESTGGVARI